jgi:exonuclease III
MQRVMRLQANLIFRLAIPGLLRAGYVDCYRTCHPHPPLPFVALPNGTPGSEKRAEPASTGRAGGEGLDPDGFTWHTGNRTTRYDYILADPQLAPRLRACRVLDDLPAAEAASDHYPLVADFDL